MIYLVTGTPGAGKTLFAVSTLTPDLLKPIKLPDGSEVQRRLVVDGIPNLAIDHVPLTPGKVSPDGVMGPPDEGDSVWNWPDWAKPGDLIVVDEVQRWFRPRSMGTKPPLCVQALETHRHKGVDFVFITQSPALLDQNIRRLIERHTHVRRAFGGMRSVLYDWDGCQLNTSSVKSAQARIWAYPKNAFKLYTSSSLHIKPRHKLPIWVYLLVFVLASLLFLIPAAFMKLGGALTGKGVLPASSAASAVGSARAAGPAASSAAPSLPPLPGSSASDAPPLPSPAPVFSRPQVMGCVSLGPRCSCYGEDGHIVDLSEAACRSGVSTVGGLVALSVPRDLAQVR